MDADPPTANQPNEILQELRELKTLLARLIGTADRTVENRFSEEALDKAAKEFLTMSIERGDWVEDRQIPQYIPSVPWNAGSFIRKELSFMNWLKRGHYYLYNKRDLMALGEAVKKRNIDLKRYKEFLEDKAAFDKQIARKKPDKNAKPFTIPKGIKNIGTSEIPKPDPELVRQDLARLKQEFKAAKFEAYIDVYKGSHAMLKHIYFYQKYLEPGLKSRCRRWCESFNYANHALELISGKPEKFVVQDPEMIQL